jgi:hypothetical protein
MSLMRTDRLTHMYGEIPGAAPPMHVHGAEDTGAAGEQDRPALSRTSGTVPLSLTGFAGVRPPGQAGSGYQGRDLGDPASMRYPYQEGQGMFTRLHQYQAGQS